LGSLPYRSETKTLQVTIKDECEWTSISPMRISDIEVDVGESISVPLEFTDSVSTKRFIPSSCGPLAFKLFPSPKFITVSDKVLMINPKTSDLLGTHEFDLFASLSKFTSIKPVFTHFKIKVLGNTPPQVINFVDSIELVSTEEIQIKVGSITEAETPDMVSVTPVTTCDDSSINWITLIPPSSPDLAMELIIKAPSVQQDLKCKVELTITDNDRRKPMSLTKTISVTVRTPQVVVYTSDMQASPEILQKYTLKPDETTAPG